MEERNCKLNTMTNPITTLNVVLSGNSRSAQNITATAAGQLTFVTGGYTVGLINVYLSGVRLVPLIDFTATNGTTITLNSIYATAVSVGSVLVVEALASYAVANAISASTLSSGVGSSLVGFQQSATGAAVRTVQSKLQDKVSVKDFGAVGNGIVDDTAAIQLALNSGVKYVYVPAGTYLVSSLTIPNTVGLVIAGESTASIFKKTASSQTMILWSQTSMNYPESYIRNLTLDGTNGGGHLVDTTGCGGLSLYNIYINNVPASFSGIYVNGLSSSATHDIRISNLQVYSNTSGHSAVRFGPYATDSSLSDMIMNGGFNTQYGVYMDAGAVAITISNSHPYNVSQNVMFMGGNSYCQFNGVVFDNSSSDIVSMINSSNNQFTGCYFEAIQNTYSGVKLTGCASNSFLNCQFLAGSTAAAACVTEDVTSNGNRIVSGSVGTASSYANIFALKGVQSYATGLAGYNPLGKRWPMTGATQTSQAQNTTMYLGVNGIQANPNNTIYLSSDNAFVTSFAIFTDNTPAIGQTFTYNLQQNGTTIGTLTVSNGSYGGTISLNKTISQFDQIVIQSVFSATSGSANSRYLVNFTA